MDNQELENIADEIINDSFGPEPTVPKTAEQPRTYATASRPQPTTPPRPMQPQQPTQSAMPTMGVNHARSEQGSNAAPVSSEAARIHEQMAAARENSSIPTAVPTETKMPKQGLNKIVLAFIILIPVLIVGAGVAVMLLNKDTKTEVVDKPSYADPLASATAMDLSTYSADVTISEAGAYKLSGTLEHALIINANGDVTLYLNGVTINSPETAAIANLSTHNLNIELVDGTTNNLTDGGASEQDATLYSAGPLSIDGGTGVLNVTGRQEEGEGIATESQDLTINGGVINVVSADDGLNAGGDGGTITINDGTLVIDAGGDGIDSNKNAVINGGHIVVSGSFVGGDAGIDTDDGFEINGGWVFAMGTDMVEAPLASSKQNTIVLTLDEVQSGEGVYSLVNAETGVAVMTTAAIKDFRTLVLSSPDITEGTYNIARAIDGSEEAVILSANGETNIVVSGTITTVGEIQAGPGGQPGEMPNGEMPGGEAPNGERPQIPDAPQGEPSSVPEQ